jgi:hypothetical protein
MVFITAVTSITKIKLYPSRLTLIGTGEDACVPTTLSPDLPPKVVTEVTAVMTLMPMIADLL